MNFSDSMIIKNGTIVTHDKTIFNMDILIKDGKIVDIDTNIKYDATRVIDAKDLLVMPGFIDMHCFIGDPGYEFKEELSTGCMAAANGGFTSITYNPSTSPVLDNRTVVEYLVSKALNESPINVYPYGSLTKGCKGKEMAEMGEMQIAGIVAVSDGDNPINDNALMRNIFKYASMFDMPVITHCEDNTISKAYGVNEGYISTLLGLKGSPNVSETIMLARNILLAEEFNVHLHVSHVSTKEAVTLIRNAKRRGAKITAETAPPYFILNENSLIDYNTFCKFNPPLRSEADVLAVIEGLKQDVIDVIVSDHLPNTIDSKNLEFEYASTGASSFETTFALAYTHLVKNKMITIEQLVSKLSHKPAQILDLNKGSLYINGDADIVIVDPTDFYTIDPKTFVSKARYTPFANHEVYGKVVHTIVKGKVIL